MNTHRLQENTSDVMSAAGRIYGIAGVADVPAASDVIRMQDVKTDD